MTTIETRAALHHRLSTALEEALGAAAVWQAAAECPQGHPLAWIDPPKAIGSLCNRCADAALFYAEIREHRDDPTWHPEWRLQAGAPVDWDDPAILWARWERWVSRWIHAADSESTRIQRITYTLVVMRTAIDMWWEMEEPTTRAALATAWDALLTQEGKVHDD